MKQLLLIIALLFMVNTHAQTTQQDSLLLKAGRQGTTSTLLPVITGVISAPLLTQFDKPEIIIFYSAVNGISIFASYVLRLSAWGNIKKAARVNDVKQPTNKAATPKK
jgi:hypothetical protein